MKVHGTSSRSHPHHGARCSSPRRAARAAPTSERPAAAHQRHRRRRRRRRRHDQHRRLRRARGGQQGHRRGVGQDPRGRGRRVRDLLRRLGRPEPGRGRRASRPTTCTSRSPATSPAWSRRASSPRTGTTDATKGVVSSSVVVFAVRPGNPKNIQTWDDLIKPGVEIVTPNPASSGAARWNALAAYGQVIEAGGTEAGGRRVPDEASSATSSSLPNSGRDATTAFLGGTGDVLMAYENEAILAHQNGEEFDYIIPETTMLIENPGAVLKDANPKAKPWLDFVLSADGQKQFALKGFRPVIDGVEYGEVEGANDPSNPFPEVDEPADRRRRLRELGRACRRSSSTRRTASSPRSSPRPARPPDMAVTALRPRCRRTGGSSSPAAARRRGPGAPADLGVGRRPRRLDDVVQPPRPDPARRRGRHRRRRRAGAASGTPSPTSRRWPRSGSPSARRSLVTIVNVVMGTLIAWVLVRDDFFGKRALEVLIDIPFALPDDRRRPRAAVAVRAAEPARRQHRQQAVGGVPGLPVRHAARSSCAPCSRCWPSSTARSRRRPARSGRRRSRPSAGSCCRA